MLVRKSSSDLTNQKQARVVYADTLKRRQDFNKGNVISGGIAGYGNEKATNKNRVIYIQGAAFTSQAECNNILTNNTPPAPPPPPPPPPTPTYPFLTLENSGSVESFITKYNPEGQLY